MIRKPMLLTKDEYLELCDLDGGLCLSCCTIAYGVEPDTRGYECDACGEFTVFGVEEALLGGEIKIAVSAYQAD